MEKTRIERIDEFIRIMGEALGAQTAVALAEKLERMGFFDAPASTKYHSAYPGGLYDHSKAVMDALLNLTHDLNLEWSRPESPCLIGMLHDLCKCDQYEENEEGGFSWRADQVLCGHGDKSAILAQQLLPLTEEEILCIRWHMGAYCEKSEWGYLGAAIESFPNVLYTHTADMIASRVWGV
jgi:23S rRNA maturation-related 3'-5' exoribonuclease YhaM